MNLKSINNAKDITTLLECVNDNKLTWQNKFKTFEEYKKWILKITCDDKSSLRVRAVFDNEIVLGYSIVEFISSYNQQELYIHDVFIKEDHRNIGISQIIFEDGINLLMETEGTKRIKWYSSIVPFEYWQKRCLGYEVKPLSYYAINRDEKNLEHYRKLMDNDK